MEMSPEEQWRKAESDAEKVNKAKTKLESGSTEYILGHDSDKIPEWVLEKEDEKEEDDIELQKRSSSPSSQSTDSSDTETTFVRMEDLCPTTSSMSNLVDVMACSSPHEKLIVDLRDSLFMLLHGKNEKKEMAIGTLQEREVTGAQILFWVANGALHCFDEMEVPLQSLDNLSPHIVLFSEHMVITIALHSDCTDDDSDSSSISSSSTLVTSSSDLTCVSEKNGKSPPMSSAFEDDDDNLRECIRWKAPELIIDKKMAATKKSVVFSIGMMLCESLTLEIPFGEYEAATAGQKILNGERPDLEKISLTSFSEITKAMLSAEHTERPTLSNLKREFIQKFPPGTAILTMSDAIGIEYSNYPVNGSEACSWNTNSYL
ncbi:uncharacterized protein MONOS_16711 [Monocercomonoides exilis]|uniref:uncharacterized protein n=1 Tax=Monocercomonoides exilis TaxID=2049356 RepID=UPI003559795B|nr:hypothetical protein MONOS_16711 [Monocercomonoides exilis]|eukprot:MONOS_16711.1-p1 / transcript=MONOS_16711.1 / gene=MONOS_16711 / organism=Monocercomonoides_exilis_PA203 / gene_product=unspecified product / transcript_product=unspecified product / location=Mono_scaffold02052:825-2003(-) / protein_length=374 / sequence_SO=supercontig / SO=protein_coding / is_pseudo=false